MTDWWDDMLAEYEQDGARDADAASRCIVGDREPWPADKAPMRIKEECPICGAGLLLNAGEVIEQAENGEWIASEIILDCETEPDIDSAQWEEWHRGHYRMPYVDWLPLEMDVLEEVQRRYFFAP